MLSRREGSRGACTAARPALLAFVIGGRAHALSLALVAGVAEIGTVTRLPSSDPLNLGLIVHRGAVLPLVDLGRRLAGTRVAAAATPLPATATATATEPGWPSGPSGTGTPGAAVASAASEPSSTGLPAAASLCIISRSEPAVAFPVEAVLGLQPSPAQPDPGAAPPWEILDPLVVDLARGQDPAD
jgi:hypothetical protein